MPVPNRKHSGKTSVDHVVYLGGILYRPRKEVLRHATAWMNLRRICCVNIGSQNFRYMILLTRYLE